MRYNLKRRTCSTLETFQRRVAARTLNYFYIYLIMEMSNRSKNWTRDVWYMQLTCGMSHIRKYKTLPRVATGRNSSRAVSIFNSVSFAILSFSFTCAAVCFVVFNTDISSTSSIKGPFKRDGKCRGSDVVNFRAFQSCPT